MTLQKIREIIADQLNLSLDEVLPSSDVQKDLGADSLDIVEMLMQVESEWNIIIDDDDLGQFTTVESVATYVDAHKK